MSKRIVLVDGHSIANRAFYGIPMLTNAKGVHTNAVYGFLNIVFKLIEEEKPDYLVVAFDMHAPTFRHKMFEAYKGTRKPMPEELREQIPIIKEIVAAFGFLTIMQEGIEADDILGTVAKKAQADGLEVSLVSGDRDLLQIADEHIKIRIPKTKMGKTEIEDYYPADVVATFGVTPSQFIELKALMGDTADNIPGVPKVGEKTAKDLMTTYGSIESIYEHVDQISKKSIRESLIANRQLADLSKALATIKIDCDLDFSYDEAQIDNIYNPAAYEMCKELGLKKILERFDKQSLMSGEQVEGASTFSLKNFEKKRLDDFSQVDNLLNTREEVGISIDLYPDGKLAALGVCIDDVSFCIPNGGMITSAYLQGKLEQMADKAKLRVFDAKSLYACTGDAYEYVATSIDGRDSLFDIKLAAYLINPLGNDYTIEDIALEYLNMDIASAKDLFGKLQPIDAYETDLTAGDKYIDYMCTRAYVAKHSAQPLKDKLQELEMDKLFTDIEMPTSYVLYSMEREGIVTDKLSLVEYGKNLEQGIADLEKSIHSQAGAEFNINSPKQLGEILFEKLGMPGGKKTKTGYSTAADVLEKLAGEYPIVKDILEYRTLTKLKSTYADGLAVYIDDSGRIHSHFNQTITATGRISSTDPNLQNIPTRTALGRELRKVFTASKGNLLIDADYSQIELRVLAHMSGDEKLIEAYNSGSDIHAITAATVFGLKPEEVTPDIRRNAKAVNFGIVYGISSFGLSQDLSISVSDAKKYINDYFQAYPGIKTFLDNQIKDAKEKGYVITAFGRRRPVPEIADKNFMRRSFGERIAMNSPIQGTAADIMKLAMIGVYRRLKKENLKSKLILQVHDELTIDAYPDELEIVSEILRSEMENAANMRVKLEVDLNSGFTWYDAH